jgi:hypothetical protein
MDNRRGGRGGGQGGGRGGGGRGGGNQGPAFTEAKIINFLEIMGEVVPIGPLEWGVVAERHHELFGAKNCDVTSLWHKFNVIATTVPPTSDPNIPAYIQLAKDIMRTIEVRMDSGDVVAGDLGIKGVDDFEEEEEELPAGDDANKLMEDFNENELVVELRNNQQTEGAQLRNNLLCNDLPVGLYNRIMVPQTPAVAVAPYQAYLANGSMTRPPFIPNRSAGKVFC